MAKRLSWAVRIERAKEKGRFSSKDKWLAHHNGWGTCAIGEKRGWVDAVPPEPEQTLGIAFGEAVWNNRIWEAESIYAQIQALP